MVQMIHRRDSISSDVPEGLTQTKASQYIMELEARRPITVGQTTALKRMKVTEEHIPELFVEARKMIDAHNEKVAAANFGTPPPSAPF